MSSSSKAGTRITSLLDDNSFVEIGARVTARTTDFNQKPEQTPSDGVITGYGVINGSLVFVYSQDASVLGGSIGEMHAKKIAGLYDMAIRTGAPIIGLIDSTGLRLQEATDALNAMGTIYAKQAAASGVVPQITAVFGNCGGGLSLFPAMTDFSFMSGDAKLFVNSPNALAGNSEDVNDTASASAKSAAGAVDGIGSEDEILAKIRTLVALLPSNNEDSAVGECTDDLNRSSDAAAADPENVSAVLADVADDGAFFEVKKDYAADMVTGLLRLNGTTAGAVANADAKLTTAGCRKAARFVNFCDAFNIPVITLTNADGFAASAAEENTVAAAAAELTYAFANASVPKVNVICGKAFGSAYNVMNSKATGADITVALPGAKVGMMDAKLAVQVIAGSDNAEDVASRYDALQNSIDSAASHGYVDEIVEPADLRKYLIGAEEMLFTKQAVVEKKHGTV
ncbi:MAG: carboxyl transferase [Lachnospiraceae bacterium]|jgi:acetyl-CoA carboxylase carboxyltransferase component|nr:carboxyl transferase [Lachnospiraceae bacterium]